MPRKHNIKNNKYKYGDIYRHNGDEFYKVNDVRDLEYDNKSFRHFIDDNKRMKKSYEDLKELIDYHKERLKVFLENVTNVEQDGDLNTLISLLDNLLVIKDHSNYSVITLDIDGYIENILPINGIILEHTNYPDDILKGYYTVKDNKIVKDEERCNQLYNQI